MRGRRRRYAIVMAIALAAGGAPPALACSCAALPTAKHFKAADLVFVGTAMAVDATADGVRATFAVGEVYKGKVEARADVRTASSSDVCGVPFMAGRRYAVFATQEEAGTHAGLCGGTSDDPRILAKAGITKTLARYDPGARPESPVAAGGGGRGVPVGVAVALLVLAGAAWGMQRKLRARRATG